MTRKLYSYWRSSTSYKVRIALNLKGLEHEIIPVHLVKDGGEHRKDDYTDINPMAALPTLIDGEHTIRQSNTILEYLEDTYPEMPLLPDAPIEKSTVREIMNIVSNDIHPLNNLRVLQKLTGELNVSQAEKNKWYTHWITAGFNAIEVLLKSHAGNFCYGDLPSMADCTLVPQIYNAHRFKVDLSPFPTLLKIEKECLLHPAFIKAHPDQQPDANT